MKELGASSLSEDILTVEQLLSLPPYKWLIHEIIPCEGTIGLWGAPESAKSFLALDWALTIACGIPWLGRFETTQGPVLYIAAEGGRGIKQRVESWMLHHQIQDPPAYFRLAPLNYRSEEDVEAFLEDVEHLDLWPDLIVVDTLAQSFGGGDENASSDMSTFMTQLRHVTNTRGASNLVVHHSNATGGRERGNTAFRGALDASFRCVATHEVENDKRRIVSVKLESDKAKDWVGIGILHLRPLLVKDSLVFVETEAPEAHTRGSGGEPAPMRRVDMLRYLGGHGDGLTAREWMLGTAVPKSSFFKRVRYLTEKSLIYRDNGKYFVTPENVDLAFTASDDDEE